jgi:D-alanyl-lipoteichoic acid acyltransferase DltB (MBOAT superfamily)
MDNFKTPYLSTNIAEFWQRWHISLSTWFRDYLYFPMGGNRVKKIRWMYNIIVVFVVSGLWHGANVTFIIWGALYALVYLLEELLNKTFKINFEAKGFSLYHLLLSAKTFIIVSLIWVFFRSQSFTEAIEILRLAFHNFDVHTATLDVPLRVWIMLFFFFISDLLLYNKRIDISLQKLPTIPRWAIYSILIFSIIVFSGVDNFPFIYFQF